MHDYHSVTEQTTLSQLSHPDTEKYVDKLSNNFSIYILFTLSQGTQVATSLNYVIFRVRQGYGRGFGSAKYHMVLP